MGMLLMVATRNLIQAKRRTALLGLALGAVTALLVLLLSLSQGLTDTMMRAGTAISSGHVNVGGFYKAKASDAAPLVTNVTKLRKLVSDNTPGLDYVIDRSRGWARIITERSSINCGLSGIDVAEESRLFETVRLAQESEYVEGGRAEIVGNIQDLAKPNGALLFAAQAKRLSARVGDSITVMVETDTGARNTAEFTVVAVAKDIGYMSNWNVFLSKEGLRNLYRLDPDISGAVMIYLKDASESEAVMSHLRGVLADNGYALMEHDPQVFWMKFEVVAGEEWKGQKLDLTTWTDEMSFFQNILVAIDTVSYLLISILTIIIGIGIMNAMWMSVRERTTEVGTLRAIGMSRRRVMLMFLVEAVVLALVFTSLGGLIGFGLAQLIDAAAIGVSVEAVRAILMSDVIHLVAGPRQIVTAVITFSIIAGISALWPAYRASRLQPVTAIQHVG